MKFVFALVWMLAAAAVAAAGAEPSHRLNVEIRPRFAGAPLAFDTVTHRTARDQLLSVTRLDFLLSNMALRRTDGGWFGLTNWFAYLSPREGRAGFELNHIPAGGYDRVRFDVGVPPAVNHADPARFVSSHPLNPGVNGLHWNWQGGYVFFALEGHWQPDPEAAGVSPVRPLRSGYSYHIATVALLTTVELPLALDLSQDFDLHLALNVDRIFSGQHSILLGDDTVSTHSREGDPLAGQLRDNLQRAFAVQSLFPTQPQRPGAAAANGAKADASPVLMASDAKPYRLVFSRFFSPPTLPLDNPLTEEGVELGRLLFFDPRLSRNNTQSCASCHQPEVAFADRDRAFSLGADGQPGPRNAMALVNLAWKSVFFWDGRAPTLREQVLQPIQNPLEMHETLDHVTAKLQSARVNRRHLDRAFPAGHPVQAGLQHDAPTRSPQRGRPAEGADYPSLFARAFGSPEINADRLARALEQFLLSLVSHDSKFDRFAAGQVRLTAEEQHGLGLFRTEYDPRRGLFGADCFHCHGGPLFQSQSFANNGLDAAPDDPGRWLVTRQSGDRGKFAVPSLRNVALTAPYMHDGRFSTLEEVVEHYTTGVKRSPTLDPNLAKHPGGGVPLSDADKRALVAFLKTLTDEP